MIPLFFPEVFSRLQSNSLRLRFLLDLMPTALLIHSNFQWLIKKWHCLTWILNLIWLFFCCMCHLKRDWVNKFKATEPGSWCFWTGCWCNNHRRSLLNVYREMRARAFHFIRCFHAYFYVSVLLWWMLINHPKFRFFYRTLKLWLLDRTL